MQALLFIACALAAAPDPSAKTSQSAQAPQRSVVAPVQVPKRTLQEWREVVQEALKAQAAANETQQPAATLRLVNIYRELVAAGSLYSGEDKRLRSLVRARLLRVGDEVGQDLRTRTAHIKSAKQASGKPAQAPARLEQDRLVLAQWRGALAQFGGPAAGGGAQARDDDGEELVDLIQSVISPDFWEKNGGPGTVVYFQSLHVLAVRATTEKHEQIADLLEALRRAGN